MTRACVVCSAPFEPVNSKHHLCETCQVIRDLSFMISRRECRKCGRAFWPAKRAWRKCPGCTATSRSAPIDCKACGRSEFDAAPGLDKTCVACVQSSADMARRYLASLLRDRPPISQPPEG